MEMKIKKSYEEVSIKDYYEIIDTIQSTVLKDIDKKNNILSILSGVELDKIEELPFNQTIKYFKEMDWAFNSIPTIKIPESVIINDKQFYINREVSKMTASEYIDFFSLVNDPLNLHKVVSLFIKPGQIEKGFFKTKVVALKEYDQEEHQDFLFNNLNIVLATSLMFFFVKMFNRLISYIKTSLGLLTKRIKMRLKIRKMLGLKDKQILLDGLEALVESQKRLEELMTIYTN